LEKNPDSGGIPAIAAAPSTHVHPVTGMDRSSPPIFVMSVSSWRPCMTLPAPRNSRALKKAWVISRKMAAEYAPTPAPKNMNPSWLMVEYASMRLMSSWPMAVSPA
jgi:hypothetical protein